MNLTELNKIAIAMVAAGQGHSRRRRNLRHDQEALRRSSPSNAPRTTAATIARCCSARSEAMKNHISGVILYDETICQKCKNGTPLVEMIAKSGSIPGIKVDEGTKPLPGCPANSSPKASTGSPSASRNITRKARASPSGAR